MGRLFAGTAFDIPPTCPRCEQVESECVCDPATRRADAAQRDVDAKRLPPEKQTARVRVEKRKANRRVTVVDGLAAEASDLPTLLSKLQSACGSGGTVKGDVIELQGDQVVAVKATLTSIGYRVT